MRIPFVFMDLTEFEWVSIGNSINYLWLLLITFGLVKILRYYYRF